MNLHFAKSNFARAFSCMESSGLREVLQRRRNKRHMKYRLNMFYFMPPPEWLVRTHLPAEPHWQLLAPSASSPTAGGATNETQNGRKHEPEHSLSSVPADLLSVEQFERIPKLYSHFFVHELDFAPADRSAAVIRIPMPVRQESERPPGPGPTTATGPYPEVVKQVVVLRLTIPGDKRMSFKAELSATEYGPNIDSAKLAACGTAHIRVALLWHNRILHTLHTVYTVFIQYTNRK